MNTMLEKSQELRTSILRFGAQARAVIREVCTFEFLGLATMLLPALMASVGFFDNLFASSGTTTRNDPCGRTGDYGIICAHNEKGVVCTQIQD